MMDRRDGFQQKMLYVTLEALMPERHILRDVDRLIDFDFVYELVEGLYSFTGRRSIDPVIIVKMLLLGYLYGIDSERRLEQEVQVNIAFRWFLGIDLDEPVPDHSTLSQLRRRKFKDTRIFEKIFAEIVRLCIEYGLVDGRLLMTDSTHVKANARNDLVDRIVVRKEPSEYLQRLNEQAEAEGLLKEVTAAEAKELLTKEEVQLKSPTDPDCGFMKRKGKPLGFYYLSHQTNDGKYGMITDVYVTPGNESDAACHSQRIQHQINEFGFHTEAVCADSGYGYSEIHWDMLNMGIKTFIPVRKPKAPQDGVFNVEDFLYDESEDVFICPCGQRLEYSSYRYAQGQKSYVCKGSVCGSCQLRHKCLRGKMRKKVISRPYHWWATKKQNENNETPEYYRYNRLRKIFCEGNFSHQKARFNLSRLRKRGLGNAFEHCLLSATAFNIKRMVKLMGT